MKTEIRNIIFDLGNVLVNLDGQRCIDAFHKIGGEDLAKTIKEQQLKGLFFDTEVGNINEQIFCERIRQLAGKPLTDEEIVWAWNELLTGIPDEKKARLLELRKKYKIFLLSNTNEMHWRKCAEDFFPYGPYGTEDYFDRVFLSYEMHLIKPDEKIFRETLSQAGLKAEETLFIDDRKENCEGAAKVGIQTFLNAEPDDWMGLEDSNKEKMRIIYLENTKELDISPSIATIGFFDGVHLGHQFLIGNIIKQGKAAQLKTTVITFDRHPRQVLHADYQPRLLSSLEEKLEKLQKTAVDNIVVLHFTKELATLSAQNFMKSVLKEQLNVRRLVMGYDNRFGHNKTETFDDYVHFGKELGIEVIKDTALLVENSSVSSSVIRRHIEEGDIRTANRCLGEAYTISGNVVSGHQNGRKLGFPTANIDTSETFRLIPAPGVYAVSVKTTDDGATYGGMLNIGIRPTFNGREQTMEVNLFGFEGDLYGKKLEVAFIERIREERKFGSTDELAAQLSKDRKDIEKILKTEKNG